MFFLCFDSTADNCSRNSLPPMVPKSYFILYKIHFIIIPFILPNLMSGLSHSYIAE